MDSTQLKAFVERRHPDYKTLLPHWEFMEACYVGGREWFTVDNIFRYLKEGDTEYSDRKNRAYRFNHTREVVDLVNKYLFRAPVKRKADDAPEGVTKFWKSATTNGLSIEEFVRIGATKSSILGCPWIIVDNDMTEGAVSKADEAEHKGVYCYVVSPVDILDMSYDELGDLNWIKVREKVRDDADPFGSTGDVKEKFRLWTRTSWVLVASTGSGASAKFEIEAMGEHDLGVVPAIRLDNSFCADPYSSPALIADIAYLDRACANYASNLDAIIQDQAFSQLAMPAQNVLPGDNVYEKILEMGTKRIFLYDGEGGKGPEFLSPDPRQAQLIISAIQQLINEIYHSVGLAGERTKQDNAKGIDNSSGVAKNKDFERVVALLAAKADALETVENKLVDLVCRWTGETPPKEALVSYSEDFDVRGLRDELDLAMQLSVMDAPETMMAEQMKALVKKLFPDLGKELKTKMEAEIAEWVSQPKETSEGERAGDSQKSKLLEESKRDRTGAGSKQSDTKNRETDSTS